MAHFIQPIVSFSRPRQPCGAFLGSNPYPPAFSGTQLSQTTTPSIPKKQTLLSWVLSPLKQLGLELVGIFETPWRRKAKNQFHMAEDSLKEMHSGENIDLKETSLLLEEAIKRFSRLKSPALDYQTEAHLALAEVYMLMRRPLSADSQMVSAFANIKRCKTFADEGTLAKAHQLWCAIYKMQGKHELAARQLSLARAATARHLRQQKTSSPPAIPVFIQTVQRP